MMVDETCVCVSEHRPPVGTMINRHHIRPLSWGGPDRSTNLVLLCPNGHELVHRVLNLAVKLKSLPTSAQLKAAGMTSNRYLLSLAFQAWNEHINATGGIPTKYTLRWAPQAQQTPENPEDPSFPTEGTEGPKNGSSVLQSPLCDEDPHAYER